MKVTFKIYQLVCKTVCKPFEDYYARPNDWYETSVKTLEFCSEHDTKEDAIKHLSDYEAGEYTILESYNYNQIKFYPT